LEADVFQAVVDLVFDSVDWSKIDLLLGIEAMGLPLTSSLSLRTGLPQVVARKRSYGLEGEITIDQTTGYSKGSMYLNDINPGESIAIVDDVLSTGGTLDAVIKGVERAGAHVSTIVAVVEKGPGLKMLKEKYPAIDISSIVRLTMNGAEIVLLDEVA
jgi:adenine phosphoribosyltransferase